jgi:hypothetical protein
VACDLFPRPLVIFSRSNDKLHLITTVQKRDIRIEILAVLATRGRLQIHDSVHARVDSGDVVRTAGLDEHRSICIANCGHQRKNVSLKQGFSSGDLDQRAREGHHISKHLIERFPDPLIKGIFRVAVAAS